MDTIGVPNFTYNITSCLHKEAMSDHSVIKQQTGHRLLLWTAKDYYDQNTTCKQNFAFGLHLIISVYNNAVGVIAGNLAEAKPLRMYFDLGYCLQLLECE